jgi:hypothetical protein
MFPTDPERLRPIVSDVRDTVLIVKGKYAGRTGVFLRGTRKTMVIELSDNVVRVPHRFVNKYYNKSANVKVLIDTAAFRCCQEILKHDTPLDVVYCTSRFKKKIEAFLAQGRKAVIREGQKEVFFTFPRYQPLHHQESQISAQLVL